LRRFKPFKPFKPFVIESPESEGVRYLLCEAPYGPFWQKVLTPFREPADYFVLINE